MKTSLDHLPLKKQRQLEALAALIRREAEVEMVILFGSHARGDWVEDLETGYFSDFDVAVIVKRPSLVEKLKVWSKIEKLGRAITDPTSLTLIVHDIKDVNEQLEKGFYFFSDIKREGGHALRFRSLPARGGQGAHVGGAAALCADDV